MKRDMTDPGALGEWMLKRRRRVKKSFSAIADEAYAAKRGEVEALEEKIVRNR